MNLSPFTIQHTAPLTRVFRLFRTMGLRHLIAVNRSNEVMGMITRKDLSYFNSRFDIKGEDSAYCFSSNYWVNFFDGCFYKNK